MQGPLKFIDLFCGIGGFHLAFKRVGCECVFACDHDKYSQQTYEANHGMKPAGDIRQVDPCIEGGVDILCAGFPCQPFSQSGIATKERLGQARGFDDVDQGNLFFNVRDFILANQPRAFVLENVKHLLRHDGGRTFDVIHETLTSDLHYDVYYTVIDAACLVPQHRERIYIVGFPQKHERKFEFPAFPPVEEGPKLGTILDLQVPEKYTKSDKGWQWLQGHIAKHQALGHGYSYSICEGDSVARTLSARYHKDGSEILIEQEGKNPRMLTPRECARLMGYPDDFKIVCSDTQAYKQFGNSVVVPVVEIIAEQIVKSLQ